MLDTAALNQLDATWRAVVEPFTHSSTGQALTQFLQAEITSGQTIYPAHPLRALEVTPLERVRVVILGQDPYHGPGQAHGLAFSVPEGIKLPPSLRNIYKELGKPLTSAGDLTPWAQQGVLLLNTVLTVREGSAASHAKRGWEVLTDALIQAVAQHTTPKVFMLWGGHAQAKAPLIAQAAQGHLVLQANHPSPLSALRPPVPFIGCGHFVQANQFLQDKGLAPIQW